MHSDKDLNQLPCTEGDAETKGYRGGGDIMARGSDGSGLDQATPVTANQEGPANVETSRTPKKFNQ